MFSLNFRQEQLAKLTPSELIETAYLSALLEQRPHVHSGARQGFSNRFESLRAFLLKIVDIVPIESLMNAISIADDRETSLLCCTQLMAINILPPSLKMLESLIHAIDQLVYDSSPALVPNEGRNKIRHRTTLKESVLKVKHEASILGLQTKSNKQYKKGIRQQLKDYSMATNSMHNVMHGPYCISDSVIFDRLLTNDEFFMKIITNNPSANVILFLIANILQISEFKDLNVISGISLQNAYPLDVSLVDYPLKSPLQILVEGRAKLQHLVKQTTESPALKDSVKLSQLYNSKMLEIVNDIRDNELKVCSLLLGAFMEEQIRVPLMKTPFHTARAIELTASTAALGVWALFSFSYGEVNRLLSAIQSKPLHVEVKEYIKGVFKHDPVLADEKYAGKLQFMIQGMDETVSCNSHYVSYSLERQLVKLCAELKIDESTPLEMLIINWDEIFKDNVLSLVVPTHHSLIARWLKWALMVHHLREELARYTSVGVIGLVNSGKSLLVSTLFNIKVGIILYFNEFTCMHVFLSLYRFQLVPQPSSAPLFPSCTTWMEWWMVWMSLISLVWMTEMRLSLIWLNCFWWSHKSSYLWWITGQEKRESIYVTVLPYIVKLQLHRLPYLETSHLITHIFSL